MAYHGTLNSAFKDLRQFFDHVPKLLAGTDARFSFFNGLGAISMFFRPI